MADDEIRSPAGNRRIRRKSPESSGWAELPSDVLSLIFRKLGAIGVLWPAQAVCRPWRKLASEPQVWRCIDMRHPARICNVAHMEKLARESIDRSGGHVEEFYAEGLGSDDLLRYITERTTGLRCLALISAEKVSDNGLARCISRCPLLEELQISNCSLSEETFRALRVTRPELKRFSLNKHGYKLEFWWSKACSDDDIEALEIAGSMPQLHELQLIGNHITNEGLRAILDKCLLLESLDIRACLNVTLDESLRARLARIRNVRLPHDSTADYEIETGNHGDDLFAIGYSSRNSGINHVYDGVGSDDFEFADYCDDYGVGSSAISKIYVAYDGVFLPRL